MSAAKSRSGDDEHAGNPDAEDTAASDPDGGEPAAADTPAAAEQPGGAAAPDAAPIAAPRQRGGRRQRPPTVVEPNAAVREAPQHGHVAFVGHDDNELAEADLFRDDAPHQTFVTTRTRIYQKFRYPGTQTVTKQLVYPADAKVPREHAARLRATMRQQHDTAEPAAEDAGVPTGS